MGLFCFYNARAPPSFNQFFAYHKKLIGVRKMKNWKKDRNYRAFKNDDGSVTYIITVDGQDVEVSAEVYKAYSHSARQLEYIEHDLKCDRVLRDKCGKAVLDAHGNKIYKPELEVSLDKLMSEDWDFAVGGLQPEDAVLQSIEMNALYCYLETLDAKERALIHALFFEHKTERVYATETGIPRKTIHDRKARILCKMYKLMKN
jgi:DNA-directed RNA polymerase specialized sigma24 family protein